MNAEMYTDILAQCLVPFIQRVYPDDHRFMQDNDPKHTSRHARAFFAEHINWWRTPPESPDANPIENLWHELKVFLLCVACHSIVPSQQHPPLFTLVCVHSNIRKLKSHFSASVYYYE